MALDVAVANAGQQQRLLEKMLAGTSEAEKEQAFTSGNADNIYGYFLSPDVAGQYSVDRYDFGIHLADLRL